MPSETTHARVFISGRSQHVTIPRAFRFRSDTVTIRRDPKNGDVILSEVPPLDEVFAALAAANFSDGFLDEKDRDKSLPQHRPAVDALFDCEGKNNA